MKKLYVGCSLLHAPDSFRESVKELKALLQSEYEVLEFVGRLDVPSEEIYQWDIHKQVHSCELFLAICDLPSLGLGYEMATAIEKLGTPTLGVAHKDANVSRLILGIQQPCFSFARYESLDQIPALLRNFAQEKGL